MFSILDSTVEVIIEFGFGGVSFGLVCFGCGFFMCVVFLLLLFGFVVWGFFLCHPPSPSIFHLA